MARLDELCTLNMGQSPDSASYNEVGDGLPFFQGNADFGVLHPKIRVWCNAPTKIAHPGDILISVRAPIGAMNVADRECCIGRGLAALTVNENLCNKGYIWYAISSKVAELNAKGIGSTFKAISKGVLGETEIPLPLLDRQHHIFSVLDNLTDLISLRKQQLAKLDELVKARFVEMFGDMLLNPLSWPEISLETAANIVSGITKGRKTQSRELVEVPYMAVSNVKDGYIDWTTVKTIMATQAEIDQYRLLPDDVLMTEGGDPDKLGRGAIIRKPLENCIHQNHIFRVRLDESSILPEFFAEYLQHQKAKRYFLRCAKQTTGIASINMKQLRALPVLVPPIEAQKIFADFVAGVGRQKLTIQQSLYKLEVLRKSLMQEYFG
nr:restriction endonuclease subunit S [uncultured Oscillibacter sp.]